MFKSESEVIEILKPLFHEEHPNTKIRVLKRNANEKTAYRETVFFVTIPVDVDVVPIIKELNELHEQYDRQLYFSGSEMGLLHGDNEHDWLFITANIIGA